MHILLIHQAFTAITEPGGTRHHELALYLAENGCRVTIIASPISYLTGQSSGSNEIGSGHPKVQIIRPPVYSALHRSFIHRVINFISFFPSPLKLRDKGGRPGMGDVTTYLSRRYCLGVSSIETGTFLVRSAGSMACFCDCGWGIEEPSTDQSIGVVGRIFISKY